MSGLPPRAESRRKSSLPDSKEREIAEWFDRLREPFDAGQQDAYIEALELALLESKRVNVGLVMENGELRKGRASDPLASPDPEWVRVVDHGDGRITVTCPALRWSA